MPTDLEKESKMEVKMPKIVCLCGSSKFKNEYREADLRYTKVGTIVLTISSPQLIEDIKWSRGEKARLDVLHMSKIDLADEVHIININGYIGESTEREIEYARMRGKTITYEHEDDIPF